MKPSSPKARSFSHFVGAALVLLAWGCQKPAPPAPEAQAAQAVPALLKVDAGLLKSGRISLTSAELVDLDRGAPLPGEVVSAPDGEAEVGALLPGRLRQVLVKEGDRVAKGAVVAVVESLDAGEAQAELARAQSQRAWADKNLERISGLAAQGAMSQSALEEAQSAAATAQANTRAAEARLSMMGLGAGSGSLLSLRSPIEGVVVERHAIVGAPVRPDESLFRIVAPGKVLILAHAPEALGDAPVSDGYWVVSRTGGGAPRCQATVESRGSIVDPRTRTTLLVLKPAQDCGALRPGAFVDVLAKKEARAPRGTSKILLIPRTAVVDVRGLPTVFVAQGEPGSFAQRTVTVRRTAGEAALVEGALEPGEQVVSAGTILLKGEALLDQLGGE